MRYAKEPSPMENFLICGNPSCRFVLALQEIRKPLRRSQLFLKDCPECGSQWLATCPFCTAPLSVFWHGHPPHCAHCHRQLPTTTAPYRTFAPGVIPIHHIRTPLV